MLRDPRSVGLQDLKEVREIVFRRRKIEANGGREGLKTRRPSCLLLCSLFSLKDKVLYETQETSIFAETTHSRAGVDPRTIEPLLSRASAYPPLFFEYQDPKGGDRTGLGFESVREVQTRRSRAHDNDIINLHVFFMSSFFFT